jgi:hypothetical protein
MGRETRVHVDQETVCYPYQHYTITTFHDDGVWWARARVKAKEAGGDRPVVGGPWHSRLGAQAAAELFCSSGKAG